jgi:Uma2 family endonuclease
MNLCHPQPKRWTREEYYRLGELGILTPDDRVELIEGEIISLPPQGPEHSHSVASLNTRFVRLFGDTHYVRVQLPLDLGNSQPEPDFSFVPLGQESAAHMPVRADLVLEVAKTSLSFDRNEKASVYAKAGIPELWILNLSGRQVEVHRRPAASSESTNGFAYASREFFSVGERLSPRFSPNVSFAVEDLLAG